MELIWEEQFFYWLDRSKKPEYIHGSSQPFGNTCNIMGIGSDDRRFVYYHSRDSTEHQLMKCEEEQEDTLQDIFTRIRNLGIELMVGQKLWGIFLQALN